MKIVRDLIDKVKPNFQKGGKLYFLHSTFDAFETFFFVPNHVTKKGAHIRDAIDLKRTMIFVVLAMVPALMFGIYNVGYQHYLSSGADVSFWEIALYGLMKVVPIIVVSYVTCLAVEFTAAQIKGHTINEGVLVTGMLIPLVMPPDIPLWMVAVASVFSIIFAKEVFGGTGMNFLNPALVARAFIFFAYPAEISGDKVWIAEKADAFSGATPLGLAASGNFEQLPDVQTMIIGLMPGSIGETSKIAILLGAIILLFTGIASARIMISAVIGLLSTGLLFNALGLNAFMEVPAYQHLLMGGFLFGAVFMATDPVSASQTPTGKIIYGFLIGFFTMMIRVVNPAYPEGTMLAILLMNVFAPLIDFYVVDSNIKRRLKRVKQVVKS
ncbi:MAG: NADH:ubiquinone reductase (Na(+)-transporting) subunit B [Bacteroidales bacterium]|nr:NADH:ubiquinone reductase (Na(+)-transporting) subunit B [Bacteroidales bacterium]MDY0217152.1 NADH:ubiquinone reductase (Na(+)-transporting) subunit B [Bacteroidales bacterium]